MIVTRDEPGRLLLLEGDVPGLPGASVAGAVGGLLGSLAALGRGKEILWHPSRICVDLAAGSLGISETNLVSRETRSESIDLSLVTSLSVRIRFWRHPSTKPCQPAPPGSGGVEVTLRVHETPVPRTRSFWMRVDGIDTREEVADFAYRLGAACGLSRQRVVHSDPRRMQIDMTTRSDPGTEPMPSIESRADYARNVVIPEAAKAAAKDVMPRFEPAVFESPSKVVEWSPGDEVRFEKRLEKKTAFISLTIAIASVLLGPAAVAVGAARVVAIFFGVLGFIVGFIAAAVVVASLPRRTGISWRGRSITVGGWFRRREIPFDRLRALELRCVRTFYNRPELRSYTAYQCDILAHVQGEAKPITLVSTESFRNEREKPYDAALPLVSELAVALAVERRITDYN